MEHATEERRRRVGVLSTRFTMEGWIYPRAFAARGPDTSPLPVLDSTRLLAGAALAVGVGRRPLPVWRGGPPDGEA